MTIDRLAELRDATTTDIAAILATNADALPAVSLLTAEYVELLFRECALFRVIEMDEQVAGYLCVMNRYASYDGEEFQWFRDQHRDDFLYIDQVAIRRDYRRSGLGWALYDDLENRAGQSGIGRLVCEVNYDPYNAPSHAFHQRRGFAEIDRIRTRGVVVSLLSKRLAGSL